MNFEQNSKLNSEKENNSSKIHNNGTFFVEKHESNTPHLNKIEVDKDFVEHPELSEEIKRKFIENNIFPVKNYYIPDVVFRGMKKNNINSHKNQIETFKKHVNNITSDSINARLRRIFDPNYGISGVNDNWFGYTLFTTPNKAFTEQYSNSFWNKRGGLFSEFLIKNKNPILIKETDASKLVKNIKDINSKNGLRVAHEILKNLKIDGIIYESDGPAIAWLDPEFSLELKRILRKKYGDTRAEEIVVFEKNDSIQNAI